MKPGGRGARVALLGFVAACFAATLAAASGVGPQGLGSVGCALTEWGVAPLRGRSIRERARALIAVAHPQHRERLTCEARCLGYL